MDRHFTIEIRDYEPGERDLTADRLEALITTLLDQRGDDGIVIVTEQSDHA